MITMERTGSRRRAATVLITTGALAMSAGVTAKRADAAASGRQETPVYQASHGVYTPVLRGPVRLDEQPRLYDLDPHGPDPEPGRAIEPVAATLALTGPEIRHLRQILREAVAGDLDLLEDTLYQTDLVDEDAVARVALAVRLGAALG